MKNALLFAFLCVIGTQAFADSSADQAVEQTVAAGDISQGDMGSDAEGQTGQVEQPAS